MVGQVVQALGHSGEANLMLREKPHSCENTGTRRVEGAQVVSAVRKPNRCDTVPPSNHTHVQPGGRTTKAAIPLSTTISLVGPTRLCATGGDPPGLVRPIARRVPLEMVLRKKANPALCSGGLHGTAAKARGAVLGSARNKSTARSCLVPKNPGLVVRADGTTIGLQRKRRPRLSETVRHKLSGDEDL